MTVDPNTAAATNTDRTLWRAEHWHPVGGNYFTDEIFVTAQGAIGIQCDGLTIVRPLSEWHAGARHVDPNTTPLSERVSDARLEELRAAYDHLAKNPIWQGTDRQRKDAEHATLLEELQQHRELVCRECEGRGVVPNREANWNEDYCDGRRTGQYSTNDPEEVDCPRCNGVGYEPPCRKPVERLPQVERNDGEPF